MAFEWPRFLNQHGIEYAEGGANTSRDNLSVHCPFCGRDDPSMHMSVNLKGKGFRCWRHPEHRGKNPARLVQALINCTWERANQIVGQAIYVPTDFMDRIKSAVTPAPPVKHRVLDVPKEFKRFEGLPSSRPYVRYLKQRGFTDDDIAVMSRRYSMRYCISGSYAGRIMFLIRENGNLTAWTGRSISPNAELRYKALSIDDERAEREGYKAALGPISHYLLWHDRLKRSQADTLLLCEGPFDALKVDVLGREHGVTATCFFTAAPTDAQIETLHDICPQFKKRLLLLDAGTFALGMRVASKLSSLGVRPFQLDNALKDPGEFDRRSFQRFLLAAKI